jgi:hypothetical protein
MADIYIIYLPTGTGNDYTKGGLKVSLSIAVLAEFRYFPDYLSLLKGVSWRG